MVGTAKGWPGCGGWAPAFAGDSGGAAWRGNCRVGATRGCPYTLLTYMFLTREELVSLGR